MHKKTACKVLNRFQHGKYLVAYVLKNLSKLTPSKWALVMMFTGCLVTVI